MERMRIFILVFSCMSLFAGGIANAAMLCCTQNDTLHMQDEMGNTMPCHQTTGDDTSNSDDQSNCTCHDCVKISTMPHDALTQHIAEMDTPSAFNTCLHTVSPKGIFQPPKRS